MTTNELQVIANLTVELTRLRQNECKHLCVENAAPKIFANLIRAWRGEWEPLFSGPAPQLGEPVFDLRGYAAAMWPLTDRESNWGGQPRMQTEDIESFAYPEGRRERYKDSGWAKCIVLGIVDVATSPE